MYLKKRIFSYYLQLCVATRKDFATFQLKILGMTLNNIHWWGFGSRSFGSLVYPFITIPPRGTLSVMIIIVENRIGDPSSNTGRGCLRLILCYYVWKRHESIFSPHTSIFLQPKATNLGKGKLNSNQLCSAQRFAMCNILFEAERLGKYKLQDSVRCRVVQAIRIRSWDQTDLFENL